MRMGRPKRTKRDICQKRVVEDLRNVYHAVVWDVADEGGEVLDLIVFWRGVCLPVEVKSPGGKLTKAQKRSIARLRAVGVEAIVAGTAEEVVEAWPDS